MWTGLPKQLESKIQPEPNSGCWLWTGALERQGYGHFNNKGKYRPAHRSVYQHLVCAEIDGLEIDHLCRTRCCVNPDHLEAVTKEINQRRGFGASGINWRKTHCKHGHLFGGNSHINARGWRVCKTCKAAAQQRARSKRFVVG